MKALYVVTFSIAACVVCTATAQGTQPKQQDVKGMEASGQRDDMTNMTAAQQADYKTQYDVANAKWATMTPQEKSATVAAARNKKLADLTAIELVGQRDDMRRETAALQGPGKAEADAAKAKWDALSLADKKAVRQSAWSKRRSELTGMEAVGQRDDSVLPF